MPCQLCGSPAHSGKNHDFRSFLGRLGTADREKLLRAAAVTRAPAAQAQSGRWIESGPDGLRIRDPQSENHSVPSETIRQDE